MATSKKSTPPKEEETSQEVQHGLEVHPSMPFYCTWLPGACPTGADKRSKAAIAAPFTNPPMCPPHGEGQQTIIPTVVPICPTFPQVCVPTINPVCPTPKPQDEAQAQTQTIITCTGIPIVCGAQAQTIPPVTLLPPCPVTGGGTQPQTLTGIPHICGHGGTVAQTAVTTTVQTMPFCPTITSPVATCPPAGGAQAQGITGAICSLLPPLCVVTAIANCGSNAQAQTGPLSVPPFCPTVAPMCPPAGGAQAQGITGAICSLFPPVCAVTAIAGCNNAQAQTGPLSAPPFCPTVMPMCPPAGGAQAQTITLPPLCFQTTITQLGCPPHGGAQAQGITGAICSLFPPVCAVTAIAGCNNAQAQTVFPTLACPPHGGGAQAQGITGAICSLIPPVCAVTAIAGCNNAQAQTGPLSVPPFCPTVAPMCPPAGGAQAQTITLPPLCFQTTITQLACPPHGGGAQAQGITGAICSLFPPVCAVTAIAGCNNAQAQTVFPTLGCPPHGGGAQAQGITGVVCSIIPTACFVTAIAGC